jgi:hypothetical protein
MSSLLRKSWILEDCLGAISDDTKSNKKRKRGLVQLVTKPIPTKNNGTIVQVSDSHHFIDCEIPKQVLDEFYRFDVNTYLTPAESILNIHLYQKWKVAA